MINEEFKWICKEIYIKVIILNDSQKLTLNVLESIKYNAILKMLWLHKKNSQINWINKELYVTENAYEISKQLEKNLSEYKSWNHKILFINDKNSQWMSLYSMCEN